MAWPSSAEIVVDIAPADSWTDTTPTWVDISADVRSVRIELGRSPEDPYRWMTGKCQLTINNHDFGYDILNTLGTRPTVANCPLRVRCKRGAEYDTLFFGFVPALTGWTAEDTSAREALIHCTAFDLFGILGGFTYGVQTTPVGAYETVDARITRICDAVGVPSAYRSFGSSNVNLVATSGGVNALHHCQEAAQAEGGASAFYVRKDGTLTFDHKNSPFAPYAAARFTTNQATFNNFDSSKPSFTKAVRGWHGFFNVWAADNPNGFAYSATSAASVTTNGPSSYEASVLCASTVDTQAWVDNGNTLFRDPEYTLQSISCSAIASTHNVDVCAELDLRDRVRVTIRPAGQGNDYSDELMVIGIGHTITPNNWVTEFRLHGLSLFDNFDLANDMVTADGTYTADGTKEAAL